MSFQQAMSQSPSPPLDGITEANMPQPQLSKGKVQAVIMETERVFFYRLRCNSCVFLSLTQSYVTECR